ncbi:MAG: nuclease-related domain-containing protein [Eubacteriales bacterium]|nr:nuclease-related domain-containing protein [Eubacteriales bacterium]
MEYLIFPLIVFAIIIGIRIALINIQLSKSTYSQITGNTVWNLILNKGNYGEFLTYRILEKCGENKILCNVYLPKSNGETTEVDLISINSKGIFVYESKNYSGWIFGDDKSRNWTQCLKGGKKNKFYNPVFQNKGHITAIDNYLEKNYSNCFLSYIVFSERCELKKITVSTDNVKVMNRNYLKKHLAQDKNTLPDVLLSEDVNRIYDTLKSNTLVDELVKQKHIENIRTKHL